MATEAEDRLANADAALTAFEEKRQAALAALKDEGKAVSDEYRAAHNAVEADKQAAHAERVAAGLAPADTVIGG